MIALLLTLQGVPAATVGDTVWVSRSVSLPQGAVARPSDWTLSGDIEVLGPGVVVPRASAVEVRYPLAVWVPGPHIVDVPGPLILLPGGVVDSMPSAPVTVTVRSVLPDSGRDTSLVPQPAASLVLAPETDPHPLMLWVGLGLGAALLFLYLTRPRPRDAPVPATPSAAAPLPLSQWATAGEGRAACEVGALRLRLAMHRRFEPAHPGLETAAMLRLVEGSRPQWPVAEIRRVLGALDAVRFGVGGGGGDVGPLLEDADRLAASIEQEGA